MSVPNLQQKLFLSRMQYVFESMGDVTVETVFSTRGLDQKFSLRD